MKALLAPKFLVLLTAAFLAMTAGVGAMTYNEAPDLAEQVEAGELPPVEERLPEPDSVFVVDPVEQIGRYGGVARTATATPLHSGGDVLMNDFSNLVTTDAAAVETVPHLVRDVEISEDMTTFTMHMREGMRWSDGEPLTSDDVVFWYEDVLHNEDLTPSIGTVWLDGETGRAAEFEQIDEYTFRFTFSNPRPFFLNDLVHQTGVLLPSHYLKQYHIDYVDEDVMEDMLEEEGFDAWYELYGHKNQGVWGVSLNPERPGLTAYVLESMTADRRIWVRNPYYWKVDTEGNQLPYLDGIDADIVSDMEVVQGMIMSGQLDFAARNTELSNYPLYREHEAEGGYRTILWDMTFGTYLFYQFNLTDEDPVLREIFQDRRFRQAMSLALDREEMNEVLYFGQGAPRQYTVLEDSVYFEPEFATAYTEYDVERANALLDEMGLDERDSSGYRLRPDGETLMFEIQYVDAVVPRTRNVELVQQYWQEVGVDVRMREISGELASERVLGNMISASNWAGDGSTQIMFNYSAMNFLVAAQQGWSGPFWPLYTDYWQSGGERGEEPIPEIQAMYDWYQELVSEPDEERRIELAKNILRSHAENTWIVGTVGEVPHPIIVGTDLRNFPEEGLWGWDTGVFNMNRHPAQMFFDR